ncbi:MAG: phosphatidylglycerophosphatase A [Elusimicrobium sp.]|jgi:phosphatidylglycerophosphatase A|nr:phosphatidylglycerophosphatase A [Elusimicrobium sp.]
MKNFFDFLASGFGVSLLPTAILKNRKNTGAGFLGTLVAVPFVFIIPAPPAAQIVTTAAFIFFAVWVTSKATFEGDDNPKIVIDETAGYFCAVCLLPRTWSVMLAAFIMFRIFDTLKPFGIKKLDNIKNAWGVVLDDVAGGILANILIQIYFLIK